MPYPVASNDRRPYQRFTANSIHAPTSCRYALTRVRSGPDRPRAVHGLRTRQVSEYCPRAVRNGGGLHHLRDGDFRSAALGIAHSCGARDRHAHPGHAPARLSQTIARRTGHRHDRLARRVDARDRLLSGHRRLVPQDVQSAPHTPDAHRRRPHHPFAALLSVDHGRVARRLRADPLLHTRRTRHARARYEPVARRRVGPERRMDHARRHLRLGRSRRARRWASGTVSRCARATRQRHAASRVRRRDSRRPG